MKKLVLIGGGGYCSGVLDSLRGQKEYEIVGITDPSIAAGEKSHGATVLGTDAILPQLYASGVHYAFVTVGSVKDSSLRIKLTAMAKKIGFHLITVVDPTAVIAETARLGEMVYVGKRAVINADVIIGNGCLINTGSIVEHGCRIGDFVHVAPGAVLAGDISVGDRSHIGLNATLLQGIQIGAGAVIGAGAIILRDVQTNEVAVGLVKKGKSI